MEGKAFPGAIANCLKHIQPCIPKKPNRFVIHSGTNNLNSDDTSAKIPNDIIQLAKVFKTEKNDVVVFGICSRRGALIKR